MEDLLSAGPTPSSFQNRHKIGSEVGFLMLQDIISFLIINSGLHKIKIKVAQKRFFSGKSGCRRHAFLG